MRFLFVANTSWYIYNFRKNLLIYLNSLGHEIYVLAPEDIYSSKIEKLGIKYIPIKLNRKSKILIMDLFFLKSLLNKIKEIDPQIIHLFTIKPVIYGSIAARICKTDKIFCSITGLGYMFNRVFAIQSLVKFFYYLALRADNIQVIFQNPEDKLLFESSCIVNKNKSHLILGSGIDIKKFTSNRKKKGNRLKFGLFARIIREKGIVEFINAAEIISKKYNNCDFILVGDIDLDNPTTLSPDWLKSRSGSFVNWLGHVEDIKSIMDEVDVVVLPSYREGLPKSLLEGASLKKALLATNIPGCKEIVKDNINGKLIRPKSIKELSKAMDWYINNTEKIKSFGKESRKLVIRNFSDEIIIEQTCKLYFNI